MQSESLNEAVLIKFLLYCIMTATWTYLDLKHKSDLNHCIVIEPFIHFKLRTYNYKFTFSILSSFQTHQTLIFSVSAENPAAEPGAGHRDAEGLPEEGLRTPGGPPQGRRGGGRRRGGRVRRLRRWNDALPGGGRSSGGPPRRAGPAREAHSRERLSYVQCGGSSHLWWRKK